MQSRQSIILVQRKQTLKIYCDKIVKILHQNRSEDIVSVNYTKTA